MKYILLAFYCVNLSLVGTSRLVLTGGKQDSYFVYDAPLPIDSKKIENEFYAQIVNRLPVLCVDILVVDKETHSYLLIYRKNEPAKNLFWVLGGRVYKGESFFDTAKRKCKEEAGIDVIPVTLLGIYSLTFTKSEWNCSTHTPTVGVLAFIESKNTLFLDQDHSEYKWVSCESENEDEYIEQLRKKASLYMKNNK
ncbi:NUDIX domain-containing protein [Candidatus Babeliales bacterium]|nr:NUDIX domain-containing protein [Candidatus Babeliales bacterium]